MRVFVHIGLPKTATTTLQHDLFEAGDTDCWDYWGALQPREREQGEKYKSLMSAVNGEKNDDVAIDANDSLPVVICEEMITVDDCLPWQGKLNNLKNALVGHDVTVLVTVRRPEVAAFSLYTELYHRYKRDFTSFEAFLDGCNQAKIFNYKYLVGYLYELFGRDHVEVFAFEEINSGELTKKMCAVMGVTGKQFSLGHANVRKKSRHCVSTQPRTLDEILGPWLWGDYRKYSMRGGARFLLRKSRLGKVKLPWTIVELEKPNYEQYAHRFSQANEWLYERTGINYTQLSPQQAEQLR